VMVFWLPGASAIAIRRQARREAGESPDVSTMSAALRQAARSSARRSKPTRKQRKPARPCWGTLRSHLGVKGRSYSHAEDFSTHLRLAAPENTRAPPLPRATI
jgi:hypothetical protein